VSGAFKFDDEVSAFKFDDEPGTFKFDDERPLLDAGKPLESDLPRITKPRPVETLPPVQDRIQRMPERKQEARGYSTYTPMDPDTLKPVPKGPTTAGTFVESLKTGAAGAGQAIASIPQAVQTQVEGLKEGADIIGRKIGLPEWMMQRDYVGLDAPLKLVTEGATVNGTRFSGFNDIALAYGALREHLQTKEGVEESKRVKAKVQSAFDAGMEGEFDQLVDALGDPGVWASVGGNAIPFLLAAMATKGDFKALAAIEGGAMQSEIAEYERRTGTKVSDSNAAAAIMQQAVVNGLLEKVGLSAIYGKMPAAMKDKVLDFASKNLATKLAARVGMVGYAGLGEFGTEGMQKFNENLAKRTFVDPTQSLTEDLLLEALGGKVGGLIGGAVVQPPLVSRGNQFADVLQELVDRSKFTGDPAWKAADIFANRPAHTAQASMDDAKAQYAAEMQAAKDRAVAAMSGLDPDNAADMRTQNRAMADYMSDLTEIGRKYAFVFGTDAVASDMGAALDATMPGEYAGPQGYAQEGQAQEAADTAPGMELANGFRRGPEPGHRYRVGQSAATGGAILLEKRNDSTGAADSFYIGKDGNLIDAENVALNRPETLAPLWVPPTEAAASEASSILTEMGALSLSDPKRKALKDRLKRVVQAAPAQASAPQPASPARAARPSDNLLRRINQLGGINMRYLPDVAGENKVRRGMPVGLFRKNGMGLDDLSRMLADEGFPINVEDPTDTDGVRQLTELLQQVLNGGVVLNQWGQQAQIDAMLKAEAEIQAQAAQEARDDPEAIAEREAIQQADVAIQGITNDELNALLDAAFNDERTPNAIPTDAEIDQLFPPAQDAQASQPDVQKEGAPEGSPEAGPFAGSAQKRAKVGGEFGANGEWYEGGKFIATTDRPKSHKKWKKPTGRQLIDRGEYATPPETADNIHAVALFQRLAGIETFNEDGTFSLNPRLGAELGTPEALANRKATVEAWNNGARWQYVLLKEDASGKCLRSMWIVTGANLNSLPSTPTPPTT